MTTMNYLKHRYLLIILSLFIIIGGITYGILNGYHFDIDFRGGVTIQAELNEVYDNHEIEKIVSDITNTVPLVQKVTGGNESVSISIEPIDSDTLDKIIASLQEKYPNMSEPSTRNIQPSYGKELLESAILAVSVAVVIILLYIIIRFKTLGVIPAITAVLALLHDALMIIAIYGIIGLPINSTFVAVILTIVGYSINDTIVIYDRIRENRKKVTKSKDLKDTINLSISQTLHRSIMTSITTIATVIVVLIFAIIFNQQVLKEFAIPLILGIAIGTYSSIFIATSSWYILETGIAKRKERKKLKNK